MVKRIDQIVRLVIAVFLFALAFARLLYHPSLAGRMDGVFLTLVGAGLLVILIPVQYLKSFKAAGIELTLDQPQVQSAISGLGLDRIKDEKMRSSLSHLRGQLDAIRGSRVLWIDDHPHGIVAERRLLRALGVEVLPAISSEVAKEVLHNDNDFDLIITDVHREGDHYLLMGGPTNHDGLNFILWLRAHHSDPVVRALPVLFYAAYKWENLVAYTARARVQSPLTEIANSEIDLIPKAVKLLAEARATPITAKTMKKASPGGGQPYGVPKKASPAGGVPYRAPAYPGPKEDAGGEGEDYPGEE